MVPFVPWTVDEILEWLSANQGSVFLTPTGPVVDFPKYNCDKWGRPRDRRKLFNFIAPHLIARRAEIIAMLEKARADADAARVSAEDERATEGLPEEAPVKLTPEMRRAYALESRANAIEQERERARASGKRLWYLVTHPKIVMKADGLDYIPDQATWIVVEGEKGWVSLPRITNELYKPPSRSRRKKKKKRAPQKTAGGRMVQRARRLD